MKTIRMMEAIISEMDTLFNMENEAFKTGDWTPVKIQKNKIKQMLNVHFDRQ